MPAKNDITGHTIQTKGVLSKQGRDNWDRIFGKKRSAYEWLKECPWVSQIFDPDGWRYNDGVTLDTPITKEDFQKRLNESTLLCDFNFINKR
jgi:hypothetical protein